MPRRTQKTEATNNAATFAMKNESNLMSLHELIAYAHDTLMNRRALNEADFTDHGLTKQDFDQWTAYVEEVRGEVVKYLKLTSDRKADSKDIALALGNVWSAWRTVLKQGTESEYNKNFFLRENDAHIIAEWAGLTATLTVRGKVWSTATPTNFRRNVETAIGIRMTGNAMLSDDNRDLIQAYEGAQRTVTNLTAALNDKVEKGKTTAGLRTQAYAAEKALEEMKNLVESLKLDDNARKKLLEKSEFALTEAKKKVTDAEKKIVEAQKIIDAKEKDYNILIAKVHSVGDDK